MSSLFDAILLGLLALLPLINPPTTVALFLALSQGFSREEKNQQALLTACYVFIIMTLTYYIGEFIMGVFSISIPGLRIAGGGILCIIGARMLFPTPVPSPDPNETAPERTSFAFIPLAMPSTAGPGTIAMIISSSASIKHSTNFPQWVVLVAPPLIFLCTALILWGCLRASDLIMKATGKSGIDAISRLMGFLLVCMGVQFAINGLVEVVQGFITAHAQ
ncbi:stress protection protein MarC [Pseudomonas sp. AU11447]|uniref:MarC family NAAT transporter n=1 Tax=unclassified Pseudomonas TaxID=196821 RepID=UPI0006D3E7CE|nr:MULTISPECIES: MarC family NAAT transporter [unclassified Pseudomonas]OBY89816.1 stress protection protein MarC [Pseudomonas sp. AU11447]